MLTFGSLFAGIGGLDLGFEWAGLKCLWQVEKDDFCRDILTRHWPTVPKYNDVKDVGVELENVDIIIGGFPCQDVSRANVGGKGIYGELSGLWWEYHRIVSLIRPKYFVVENVSNLSNRGLGDVIASISNIGYSAEWQIISACSIGAPHSRQRMFIVAYPDSDGQGHGRESGIVPYPSVFEWGKNQNNLHSFKDDCGRTGRENWPVEPKVGRMVDGVSGKLDRQRLKALGNAVVPQVGYYIANLVKKHYEACHAR